jgi:hypothetical protein
MTLRIARVLSVFVALSVVAVSALGAQEKTPPADQKWTGNISDSMCGKSHGANGGTMAKDHDCTLKCVKGGGAYVFVVGDKIYKLADQKMPDLERHAGHRVEIAGAIKGDTITVTKVTMLPVK